MHAGAHRKARQGQALTTRLAAGAVALVSLVALLIGVGSGTAANAASDNHGCVVTSNGYTYNCETGILSWDASVTVTGAADKAVLYSAPPKVTPQKLVAGPVTLPHGPGPGQVFLGTFVCGDFQFDVQLPGKGFLAGHKGNNGPCTPPTKTTTPPPTTTTTPPPTTTTTPPPTTTTTPPPTTTTTPPPTTTTTPPPTTTTTTTTTAPPATSTTTVPPSVSTSTSAVLDASATATYDLLPVNAGVSVDSTQGSTITAGQALLTLVALVALWLMFGAPRPRIDRGTGRS